MNFTAWLQTHRRSILFLLAILAIGGVTASFVLPVTLFPDVSFPRVAVELDSGDRTADQMVALVTRPVEEAIRHVPGVLNLSSTSSRGSAEIKVDFGWGHDMVAATQEVESAVTQMLPTLPAGTTIETKRMDPTVDPVISYSLSSDTLSLTQLYDLAQYQLRPLLSAVKGVSKIGITGGTPEEYRVTVDPARLAGYGLTLTDVTNALAQGNIQQAVGHIEDHYQLYLTVSDSRYQTFHQIAQTVLRTGPNGLVRLGDVAKVGDSTVPQYIRVTADGHDAVLMDVYQQPDGNSVQIANDIKTALRNYGSVLPPGVKLATWYDQSVLVTDSAKSVRDAILIGIVLAAIVLFVFLRNYKITIISIVVVPTVLATTVTLLAYFGMGFNIMTLGGMAAAVGLIIDDAVVMIEHIVRRLRDSPRRSAPRAGDAGGARILPAADRFLVGDDHHLLSARIPGRGHRRILQGAVVDDGKRAIHLVHHHLARGSDPGRSLARREGCKSRGRRPADACGPPPLRVGDAAHAEAPVPDPVRHRAAARGRVSRLHRRGLGLHAARRRRWLRPRLHLATRNLARRDRPDASAGRGHHPRQQERAHLLAAHRRAAGWRRDRGEYRGLLHPAEAVSARPDRRRHAAGHRQGQGAGADARHRHRPADGGPDRRPDRGAAADPGQDLQRRPGTARGPRAEGHRRAGQGQGPGRASERCDPCGRRAEHRDRPHQGGRARDSTSTT